jgi:DNA ligase (NAD+)
MKSAAARNEQRLAKGQSPLPLYASPRNSAAGSVRQLDSGNDRDAPARYVPLSARWADGGLPVATHWEILQWLGDRGFRVNPNVQRFTES